MDWCHLCQPVPDCTLAVGIPQQGYLNAIRTLALAHKNFALIMLLASAWIIVAASVTTWFITLYSTFRIAGPLFRFSQNLRLEIREGPTPIIRLRCEDQLQAECELLSSTVERLKQHYLAVSKFTGDLDNWLTVCDERQWQLSLAQLKQCVQQVRVDD